MIDSTRTGQAILEALCLYEFAAAEYACKTFYKDESAEHNFNDEVEEEPDNPRLIDPQEQKRKDVQREKEAVVRWPNFDPDK